MKKKILYSLITLFIVGLLLIVGLAATTIKPNTLATLQQATTPSTSITKTARPTFTPTKLATRKNTPSATVTATDTPLSLLDAPLELTPLPVQTATPTELPQLTIVGTLDMSQFAITKDGLIPNTPTPGPPTPYPRIVPVSTDTLVITSTTMSADFAMLDDDSTSPEHFWFGRPFPDKGAWGSFLYPYGTNSQGNYLWHFGIDISASYGNIIRAMGEGVIVHAGPDDLNNQLGPWPDFYGQAVVIRHHQLWDGQPVFTLYGHLSEVLVGVGQEIEREQPIARAGDSGVATGTHLHVEVRLGGNSYSHTRNPDLWIRPDRGFGVIIGRVMDAEGYFVPVRFVELSPSKPQLSSYRRTTYTYPNHQVTSDARYQENFTIADVPVGTYRLKTGFDGQFFDIPVTVREQQSSFVLIQSSTNP